MVLSSSVVLRINLKESVGIWVESICCRNLAKICRLNVFLVVLLVSVAMENEVAAHVLSFLPLYTVSCLSTVWRARFCKEKVYVLVTPANDPMQNMPENVLAVELPDWMADWMTTLLLIHLPAACSVKSLNLEIHSLNQTWTSWVPLIWSMCSGFHSGLFLS